jgi:hypothetical protein
MYNQNGKDLAKKCEQVLEMTKLLVGKVQKCYEKNHCRKMRNGVWGGMSALNPHP